MADVPRPVALNGHRAPTVSPRGGPSLRHGTAALGRAARSVLWWFNGVLGGQDYQRYVAHMRRAHPGSPVVSEREYWRERYDEAERNPSTRCC